MSDVLTQRERLDVARQALRTLSQHVPREAARAMASWTPGRAEPAHVLATERAARVAVDDYARSARRLNLSLQPLAPRPLDPDYLDYSDERCELDLADLRRGVQLKTVISERGLRHPIVTVNHRRLAAAGDQCRSVPVPPCLLIALDDVVVLPLSGLHSPHGALAVESVAVADFVRLAFDRIWRSGQPVLERASALTPELRTVLELLLEGWQDDAIARRTGVSVKTVRRRVQTLIDLAVVRTRFQLAAVAADMLTARPSDGAASDR